LQRILGVVAQLAQVDLLRGIVVPGRGVRQERGETRPDRRNPAFCLGGIGGV